MNDKSINFRTRPDIRFRVIAGEGVIIRQEAGEALVVNEVGARILELLGEGMSTVDLIDRMALEFDVGNDELEQDVCRYLTELESAAVEKAMQAENGRGVTMRYADLVRKCYNQNILFSALLELTYRCNLDCAFCYNDRDLQGTPLTFAQYERFLKDLSGMGTLNLALSGGEPLAHPDFFRIGATARELGFVVRIKSNGHALRSNLLRRLKQEVDPFSVDLSLHGADAATHDRQTRIPGSFERLMKNVREMQSQGMRIKFNVPLTRWNETQISAIFRIADSFGVSLTVDSAITPRDNGDTSPLSLAATPDGLMQLNDVIEQRRAVYSPDPGAAEVEVVTPPDKHCGSGSSTVTVDPHGNVYPCVQLRRVAGNLHRQSIKEIWDGSAVLEEVRGLTVQVKRWIDTLGPAGRSMGFCPGTAHLETGNASAIYPLAGLRKEIAENRVARSVATS